MEQVILIRCANEYLLAKELEKQIGNRKLQDIIKYDGALADFEELYEELMTPPLFYDKKTVIIKDISHLKLIKENLLIDYLKKPQNQVLLIMTDQEELDKNTSFSKNLNKYAYIIDIPLPTKEELNKLVALKFAEKNYQIESDAIASLLGRVEGQLSLLDVEIEKLLMFKFTEKIITLTDVSLLVSKNLEENIYEITNAIMESDKKKTIQIYYDLLGNNEDPLRIISAIASKIMETYKVKNLVELGYKEEQIAKHFNVKSTRAYYMVKNARSKSKYFLIDMIKRLATLDYEIKSGAIDKQFGVELFLLR